MAYQHASTSLVSIGVLALAFVGGCDRVERPPPEAEAVTTQVSLFNATHDVIPFDARTVHSDYAIDCDVVATRPDRHLGDVHLSGARGLAEQIDEEPMSGLELPIFADDQVADIGADCRLAVVTTGTDDDRLEPITLTWPHDLDTKVIYPDVDAPRDVPPEDQTVVARADYDDVDDEHWRAWRERPCNGSLDNCSEDRLDELLTPVEGADYEWDVIGDAPTISRWDPAPLDERTSDDADDAECRSGRDNTPLRWDNPPSGTWRIVEVTDTTVDYEIDDDETLQWHCHDVALIDGDGDDADEQTWQFCGSELLAMRIAAEHFEGDVYIDFFLEEQDESPPSVYEALTVNLERRTADGDTWETETMEAVRGHGVPGHIGLSWNAEPATACDAMVELPDRCDQIALPAHLLIDTGEETLRIRPGTIEALDLRADRRLEHIRGLYRTVADLRCRDARLGPDYMNHPGAYMEFVYYAGTSR